MIGFHHLLWAALLPAVAASAAIDLDFAEVDMDRDSLVDAQELLRADLLAGHDTDGDGSVSGDELGDPALMQRWDGDGSGRLEPPEFYKGIMGFADVNGDGRLDSLEFPRALTEWNAGEPAERVRP